MINLIAHTTTQAGLKVQTALDRGIYPTGIVVPDRELDAVNLKRSRFHGDWELYPLAIAQKKIVTLF